MNLNNLDIATKLLCWIWNKHAPHSDYSIGRTYKGNKLFTKIYEYLITFDLLSATKLEIKDGIKWYDIIIPGIKNNIVDFNEAQRLIAWFWNEYAPESSISITRIYEYDLLLTQIYLYLSNLGMLDSFNEPKQMYWINLLLTND